MALKYFFYLLFVIFWCGISQTFASGILNIQSRQPSDNASKASIDRGIEYIMKQEAARARLFKANSRDANILNHTQNIYTLFKDPEKVSLVHHAESHEKESIFKAIMASAIIHAPEMGKNYLEHLDFYESDVDLLKAIFTVLNPSKVNIVKQSNLSKALADFFSSYKMTNISHIISAEPYFCHIHDLFDEEGKNLLPKFNSLVKHFKIIIDLNRFAKAVVKSFKINQIENGQFDNCEMLLNESGVRVEDLFKWFSDVYKEHGAPDEYYSSRFADIMDRYRYYIVHNKQMNGRVAYRYRSATDELKGTYHDKEFDFGENPIDAGGGGDCGYLSLGVTRTPFVDFLSTYDFPTSGASLEETVKRAYAAVHRPVPTADLRESLISLYAQHSTWMTLEDFTLASISPLVSNRNDKPLNKQIIYVWSFVEGAANLTLAGAFYNGDDLIANDVLFQNLLSQNTTEQHIFFNGTCHFQQLNPR